MPYIDKPIDRDQIVISSLDAMVDGESTARVIDCFVDHLDLEELGFDKAEPSFEGRPCYDPASMLKLYLYGYRNNIRSSRKLAAGCNVNIEIMWLMGGLTPDFRTISDFRKDNIDCLKKVFREFVRRVTVDLETGFVSIDGSKFRAWNSKDRNFTIMKLDDRIKWLEDHTQEYLRLIEATDQEEELAEGMLSRDELEAKLVEAEERLARYRSYRDIMEKENLTQISLTDADARLMKNKNGMDVSYNVQTAVDSETHMIMEYHATNHPTDHGQITPTMEHLKEKAGDKILEAVADQGYQQPEDIIRCLENGIIPNVIPPDGSDTYELEIAYEDAECDPTSSESSEIKKTLHAGQVPKVYDEIIKDVELVTVRRKVSDEPGGGLKSPYSSEEEMKERAAEGYFVRDPERDLVHCPGEAILRKKSIKKSGATRYVNKHACSGCPFRAQCITGNNRWKEIDFGKDCLEKKAKWWSKDDSDEPKSGNGKKRSWHWEMQTVVRFKFFPNREKMVQRMGISEHPFGTIKRTMGAAYFLLRKKFKIDGEFALMAMGYNISRAENLLAFDRLMEAVRG